MVLSEIYSGQTLRLRPVRLPADIDLALPWYLDPEVLRFSEGTKTPYGHDMVDKMYRYLDTKGELYIIEVRSNTGWLAVGDATLCADSLPIVIGDPDYRGRGIGTQVLSLLMDRARHLGWTSLRIKGVHRENLRAQHLYEAAGFRRVADCPPGADMIRYELRLP